MVTIIYVTKQYYFMKYTLRDYFCVVDYN